MSSWMTCVLILIVGSIGTQCLRRQVSSRDWPEDEPEYEMIDPNKPEVSFRWSTTSRPAAPVGPTGAPVWSCGFDGHDCGITNDQIVGSYFVLKTNQMRPLLGKRHYLLLNITDIKPLSSGARLITPYFETRHSPQGIRHSLYIYIKMVFNMFFENTFHVNRNDMKNCLFSHFISTECHDLYQKAV
jgi:hypothetical protein